MVWGFDVLTTQPICDMNSLPRHFHDVIYPDAKFQLAIVPFSGNALVTSLYGTTSLQFGLAIEKQHCFKKAT